MKTVLIVDNHPFICLAVRVLLERDDYQVVAEANNGIDAIQYARDLTPDLVIVDLGIPKLDGLSVIMRLKALNKSLKVLVLSSQSVGIFSKRCMQLGASGYVCKTSDLSEFMNAVKAIKAGYDYFPSTASNFVSQYDNHVTEVELIGKLSSREITVFRQLALGRSNKEIGDDLALSSKTISCYKVRVMEKLRIKTLVGLAEIAKRNSFV